MKGSANSMNDNWISALNEEYKSEHWMKDEWISESEVDKAVKKTNQEELVSNNIAPQTEVAKNAWNETQAELDFKNNLSTQRSSMKKNIHNLFTALTKGKYIWYDCA